MSQSDKVKRVEPDLSKDKLCEQLDELRQRLDESNCRASELEATNKALRESEERLSAIIQQMPAAVFLRDLEGRFLFANAAFEKLHQVSGEVRPGQTIHELLTRDEATEDLAHDMEVVGQRRVISRETTVTRSGRTIELASSRFPVFYRTGELLGVGGIEFDIAEHKKIEKGLTDNERQFLHILTLSPVGIAMSRDLEDGPRLIYANLKYAEMVGAAPGELIGQDPRETYADLAARLKVIKRFEREGDVQNVELFPAGIVGPQELAQSCLCAEGDHAKGMDESPRLLVHPLKWLATKSRAHRHLRRCLTDTSFHGVDQLLLASDLLPKLPIRDLESSDGRPRGLLVVQCAVAILSLEGV